MMMFDWKNKQIDDPGKLLYHTFLTLYWYNKSGLKSEQCPSVPRFNINLYYTNNNR